MASKKASKKPAKPTGGKAPSKKTSAPKAKPTKKAAPAPPARRVPAASPKPAPAKEKPAAAKAAPAAPPAVPARPASTAAAKPIPAFEPVEDPDFVRRASPAERKAALQAIIAREGVEKVIPPATPPAPPAPPPATLITPPPAFVREAPATDRKAAVEQLVEESGVAGVLAKAPWKRGSGPPTPPPAAPAPPTPAEPNRVAPRLIMTKASTEPTAGRSAPKVVILDSNALMMQFQFHVDIEKEVRRLLNFNFDVVVPGIVVEELQRVAKDGNQKEAGEARMALELAKTFRIEETPSDGDTAILRLAERLNAIVVTNDKVLRARLRAKDIPNIYMRSRAFLTIEGHIPGM